MRSRIRSYLVAAAVLAILSTLAATPADAGWWPAPAWMRGPQTSAIPAQIAAGTAAGAAALAARATSGGACGDHMSGIRTKAGLYCHHTTADVEPPTFLMGAAAVQPKCYGNGVNGPRFPLVYAYAEGSPNRAGEIVPKILREYVPAIEGTLRSNSKDQGREVGWRFLTPGCKLTVGVVQIPREFANDETFEGQVGGIIDVLNSEGYSGFDRKPLVWFDGPAAPYALPPCGVAATTIVGVLPVLGDNPTPANGNQIGNLESVRSVAISFRNSSKAADSRNRGKSTCWGRPGGLTEVHELMHLLGAVQTSSPNSDKAGHCVDGMDIMCYADPVFAPGQLQRVRCNTRIPALDCGMDDYFAMRPAPGSYLSTHWNTASSRFLGDAIGIDAVPVVLPPL